MTQTHGFTLIREETIAEYQTQARIYRHDKSGAELLSLSNDDENKVFGITFRTRPTDSTGVAHILEHVVLAGSEKYPVKEPFIHLVKASLNTFLNAMTYPDKTVYPVASTNLQDFYNLIDVYLDAVFHPRLLRPTFEQEGWHFELESLEDDLAFKGVVYNEMKGNYSSPMSLLYQHAQSALLPDTNYAVDSGGAPPSIPDLTYEQFVAFHRDFYHPSNARIFFYGDDDPEERLRLLDAYLSAFNTREVDSSFTLQPTFDTPRTVTEVFPADEGSDNATKGMSMVNWLLPEATELDLIISLGVLSHVLLGTRAAPLHKMLIDAGLGEDLIGGGIDDGMRQMNFSVGLKGVPVERIAEVEPLVLDSLATLARDGVDTGQVESSLNTIEFSLRENNTGRFPRGLALMLRALTTWLHDGDPLAAIAFEEPLRDLKARIAADERFFEKLIEEYLLGNSHRVTLNLLPDVEKAARDAAEEQARLAASAAELDADARQAIVANTQALLDLQNTPDAPEDIAKLPMLKRSDLDPDEKPIPSEQETLAGAPVLFHDLFTNGVIYVDVGFDMHQLHQADLPLLSLFGRGLLQLGTETEDFVALSQRIGRKTGGISHDRLTSAILGQPGSAAWFFLRGKAMVDQAGELFDIFRDVLLTVKLDNRERFRQMVQEARASTESRLVPSGHGFAHSRVRAGFGEHFWLNEQMGGISQLFFLRDLTERVESDWPGVLAQLQRIQASLLNRQALLANVTVDADNWQQIRPGFEAFLNTLPGRPVELPGWQSDTYPTAEGFSLPSQVNFVGKAASLYALGGASHGSMLVVNKLLNTTWLWEKIRVQGGAYGGFGTFDRRSGVYAWLSYRDPNLLDTLTAYDGSGAFLKGLELSDDDITGAIIGTIGDIDSYMLPDAKGYSAMYQHLVGETLADRQQLRDEILNTSLADVHRMGELLDAAVSSERVVVLGAGDTLAEANQARGGNWLHTMRLL